ncbi:glycerol-3-phosphate dehydrogenase (NAD(+)) [Saccharomycopsis crataegensis]|uniref:Glycerol-3-phosphate dehydrogenase [NAD(+)] n=1 Tax=Saccharomycopsis crataegensis TaxID=43959 RepID=A0AAV5QKB5_9ASCO|nr:glycerol-3-phosphate dehydrogenase (NAD(+)) [Saccharomycopsis crataegensis]
MSSTAQRLGQISGILNATQSASSSLVLPAKPYKVCVIGSGNWGTTIAKVVAESTAENPKLFAPLVHMWVFEEKINGRKLTEIINTEHENVKYLPNIKLPVNVVAEPSIVETVKGADIIVFNIPHQFLGNVCKQLKGKVPPTARAISCLKGLDVTPQGCKLLSSYITDNLGIYCGALSGANLAPEVAKQKWSETTVAYNEPSDFRGPGKDVDKSVLKKLFHRPYFHVRVVADVAGVSLAGALKNVVAMAAGFVEGLGWGDNAKSAIMRIGLIEIVQFAQKYFPDSDPKTFTEESAGVADLITTCSGGRNVRVGKFMAETGASAVEAEKKLLNGQSSQGIVTTKEVHDLLANDNATHEFPLFESTYQIIYNGLPMEKLPSLLEKLGDS